MISDSKFKTFLSSVININSEINYFNEVIISQQTYSRTKVILEPATIRNCLFSSSSLLSSSIILSFSNLLISDSIFISCKTTKYGSSISSFAQLKIMSTSFFNDSSDLTAVIFLDSTRKENVSLENSIIFNCETTSSGGMIKSLTESNSMKIQNFNFSSNSAKGKKNGIIIEKSILRMDFSIFENMTHQKDCGCISIYECLGLKVTNSIFCEILSRKKREGNSIHIIYNHDSSAMVCDSSFGVNNLFTSIYQLFLYKIHVQNTNFGNPEGIESISANFINCKFEMGCSCTYVNIYSDTNLYDIPQNTDVIMISNEYTRIGTTTENFRNNEEQVKVFLYYYSPSIMAIVIILWYRVIHLS